MDKDQRIEELIEVCNGYSELLKKTVSRMEKLIWVMFALGIILGTTIGYAI
jgi:hypothetical protein